MFAEKRNVQKIEGKDLAECRDKLNRLYGLNYEIVDTGNDFKRSFFGFREKAVVVVYYVVRNQFVVEEQEKKREDESAQLERNRQELLLKNQNIMMKSELEKLSEKIDSMTDIISSNVHSGSETHQTIERIEELLAQNEFTYSYIRMICEKIRSTFSLEQLEDFDLVERYVVDWIGETIKISKEPIRRPPHVYIIVGPTGVGKTTTIAKISANKILDAKKNKNAIDPEFCIITTDTMRVGAEEQLNKFAQVLGKDVLKAETAEHIRTIYEEYKNHVDYMFIDTSGYSPNDSTHISEMKNVLSVDMNADVYLAVCASTKVSDLQNIFRNYEPFAYESVIVTKFDETTQIGNIISVLWEKHKSVSFITDGQHVPRNIKKANKVDILKNLTGFNIDRNHIENKFGEN
ncbi:MAG: flagellar biosynthesis protein FlhF [Spirochaetaceae bacterium]|nr:flagellar biosynthesis protein FlhF [Spirochaetaceae bacterium]MBE7710413.1 flagellar biosynthesis protein FlhF [Cyanobacteria bacterium SIG32]